jgi:hypothetical protein
MRVSYLRTITSERGRPARISRLAIRAENGIVGRGNGKMRMRRLLLPLLLLVTLAGVARAQESRWIADAHSGCRLWSLTPAPNERITWEGPCVGGYGQGHGVLKWFLDGALYETDEGNFVGGKLNGHATIAFVDGERFDGEFRGHLPNGRGTLRTSYNEVFSGLWSDGCFDDGKRRMSFGVKETKCIFAS